MTKLKHKRDAPIKICIECYSYMYNRCKTCPTCGYVMIQPKEKKV